VWTLHIQNSNNTIKKISIINRINILIFIISRFSLFLSFYFIFILFLTFLNKKLFFNIIELRIFCFLPFIILPFFFVFPPGLKNLIKEMENKIGEFNGRLFLVFFPYRTENDDEKWFRIAEDEANNIIKNVKISQFVHFKNLIPVIFIFPLFLLYKNYSDLRIIKPYVELKYKREYVRRNENFLILANSNLDKLYIFDGKKAKKFYRIKNGFGIIYNVEKSCTLSIGNRRYKKDIFVNAMDEFKMLSVQTRLIYKGKIEYIDSTLLQNINFLEGYKLVIEGKMNRNIKKMFSNTDYKFKDDRFLIEYKGMRDTIIYFSFEDTFGIKSDLFKLNLNIIKDNPPSVKIISPIGDVKITDIPSFPLLFEIEDDIGLRYYSIEIDNEEIMRKSTDAKFIADSIFITLKNILPDDTFKLYVKAKDVSGKIGSSNPVLIYMPKLEELFSDISKTTEFVKKETEDIRNKEEELKEKIERMIEKGNIKEEDIKEMKNVLQEQKNLVDKLENLVEFAKSLNSPEIMKEMERIKELLDQIKTDFLKKMMENKPKDVSELLEMKIEQEKLLKMLEITRKALEMIKKIADLNRAISEIEDIKEMEEMIIDSFPEGNPFEKQDELIKKTDNIMKDMKESEYDELKKAADIMKEMNIPENMRALQEGMKNKNINKMLSDKIMADLNNMIDMLKKKRDEMTGGEELREKIILLSSDIYFLIDRIKDFKDMGDRDMKIKSFAGIKEGILNDSDIAKLLFVQSLSFSPRVFENLDEAGNSIEEYIQNLSRNIISDVSLNNAISKMSDAILLLFSSPPQSAGAMMQQLMQLQQMQLSINSQMSMILPMPSPQKENALSELAAKQREIANKIGELGDAFKPLKEEMEKVAEMMENGYINEEVMKRQEKVIEQFLEAEKSIRRKEVSKKRKSEPGKYYPPLIVELPEDMGERNLLLKKLLLKRLKYEKIPEEYRKDVEEYFREILR